MSDKKYSIDDWAVSFFLYLSIGFLITAIVMGFIPNERISKYDGEIIAHYENIGIMDTMNHKIVDHVPLRITYVNMKGDTITQDYLPEGACEDIIEESGWTKMYVRSSDWYDPWVWVFLFILSCFAFVILLMTLNCERIVVISPSIFKKFLGK